MLQRKRTGARRCLRTLLLFLLLALALDADALAQTVSEVFIAPEEARINPDQLLTMTIQVKDVTGLYAASLAMQYDPSVIEVLDLEPGPLLARGVPMSEIDNEGGGALYTITLTEPLPPVNGSGILVTFKARGKSEGSTLIVLEVLLSTREGDELPSRARNAVIDVGDLPPATPTPTRPPVTPTPIRPATQPPAGQPATPTLPATQPPAGQPATSTRPTTQPPAGQPATPTLLATQPPAGQPATPTLLATQPPAEEQPTPLAGRKSPLDIVQNGPLPGWLFAGLLGFLVFLVVVVTLIILAALYAWYRKSVS